ncbi:Bug family tripartite tricarboxylate transporter substrate binding protein [Reyranella sp.]|uniref:Bug family tripartite tricarboxylate transporter substrate binding protein n=1 Tax=Reyranella sp. TaxID=1929291 RepID=UPI003BA8AB21
MRRPLKRRSFVALATAGLATTATATHAGTARAQGTYPDKPITMVVPAPPGGGTDLVARLYSDLLSQELGVQVLVDNRGGGNDNIGTAIVARAKPDGYTILMQYSAYHSANPALIKDLNWKPDDFVGVAMGAMAPHVIVVAKKVPVDDLKSFIAYAKANPGKLNYASVGAGSVPHLGGVLLNKAAGLDMVHVPYKGSGPATADIVAGQVEVLIVTPPAVSGHIRNGNVKALALASDNRLPSFPEIPTTAEAGLPGFTLDGWFALFAPAGTPQPIVDKLNAAMRKVGKMEAVVARANQLGTVLKDWTPAQMDSFAKGEVETWGKVIRDNKITIAE